MTFCTNCGADIEDNLKFCPECGTRLHAEHTRASPSPPPPAGSQGDINSPKQGILGRVDVDKEDVEVAEKAKKGFGAAWRFAKKGISKGAELASQGIEAAKDTIEERLEKQNTNQPQQIYKTPSPAPDITMFCPNCGKSIAPSKFCNNCGYRLK